MSSFRVNGRCLVEADGTVCLNSDRYRVHTDKTIEVAEYHDDGSLQGYSSCHSLSDSTVATLLERAAKARSMAEERRQGVV
jgi:hypothetical protein